jgi:hypothetical protein
VAAPSVVRTGTNLRRERKRIRNASTAFGSAFSGRRPTGAGAASVCRVRGRGGSVRVSSPNRGGGSARKPRAVMIASWRQWRVIHQAAQWWKHASGRREGRGASPADKRNVLHMAAAPAVAVAPDRVEEAYRAIVGVEGIKTMSCRVSSRFAYRGRRGGTGRATYTILPCLPWAGDRRSESTWPPGMLPRQPMPCIGRLARAVAVRHPPVCGNRRTRIPGLSLTRRLPGRNRVITSAEALFQIVEHTVHNRRMPSGAKTFRRPRGTRLRHTNPVQLVVKDTWRPGLAGATAT